MAIPPGWTEVFMHSSPDGKLQAFGFDKVGKKQPHYNTAFSALRAEAKWQRVKEFHKTAVKQLAKQSNIDMLDHNKSERDRDTAAMINLVLKTGFRPGSEKDTKAAEQAYGASTLEKRHIKINGDTITFSFIGKKGVQQNKTLTDSSMARYLTDKMKSLKPSEQVFSSSAKDALMYIKKVSGNDEFKTKDLRTWNGTGMALAIRKSMPTPTTEKEYKAARRAIGDAVAQHLGNSRDMALNSYIAPYVFTKWMEAVGITKSDTLPTFDDLVEIMDEATQDDYSAPIDWRDFDDDDVVDEVPGNYRDTLDGIKSVRQAQKRDMQLIAFSTILKDSESSKKAWITIKLKKHFGTADEKQLKAKLAELGSVLQTITPEHTEHDKAYKDFEKLHAYLTTGDTKQLDGGPKKKTKVESPKSEPPKLEAPKYVKADSKEVELAQNNTLGKHYYKMRTEHGTHDPKTAEAYAEWQKSKDTLMADYGYSKDAIGSLSATSKKQAAMEAQEAAAAESAAHAKSLQKLKKESPSSLEPPPNYDETDGEYQFIGPNHAKYESMMKKAKSIYNSLSEDQKFIIKSYTGSGHKALNKTTAGVAENSTASSNAELLHQALDTPLPMKMRLRRNMAAKWFFNAFNLGGETTGENKDIPEEQVQALVGKVYTESAFSSTSYHKSQSLTVQHAVDMSGGVILNIRAGSSARGLVLPTNQGEGEVLLNSNAMYAIKKIKKISSAESYKFLYQVDVDVIGHA